MSNSKQGELSVHPYVGGSTSNLLRAVIQNGGVSRDKLGTLALTLIGTLLSAPLRLAEFVLYGRKIANTPITQDPIFIIGHWRSGTTHLHNVVSQDSRFGYLTTLQAVFPTFCIVVDKIPALRRLVAGLLPERRMMDNVKMGLDLPQEEEFATSCLTTHAHHCNHFPRTIAESFRKYVLFEVGDRERAQWKKAYFKVLRKATYLSGGKRLVLKNPYNTARIRILLELFPNAKFIHIYRNPFNIYVSALHDFIKEAEEMALQEFSEEEFARLCYDLYEQLMSAYWAAKPLVPAGNLCEVSYETFEQQPQQEIERIYAELGLGGNDTQRKEVADYLASISDYKKNRYTYSPELAQQIASRWGFAIDKLHYAPPPDISLDTQARWSCQM